MPYFKLSTKAKADLKSIAVYTEREWGREQRNQYIRQFDQTFHLLAETPNIGQACEAIRPGYCQFPQGGHIIFYRPGEADIAEIIRILHKRMLPEIYL